jgi:hypothetical protein
MPCSRDTVNPPAPITTVMISGIHSRPKTRKTADPRPLRLFRDPSRAQGIGERSRARLRGAGRRPDRWLTSRRPAAATSDGSPVAHIALKHRNQPPLPFPRPRHLTARSRHRPRHTHTAAPRMRWKSQARHAAINPNGRFGERNRRCPLYRLVHDAICDRKYAVRKPRFRRLSSRNRHVRRRPAVTQLNFQGAGAEERGANLRCGRRSSALASPGDRCRVGEVDWGGRSAGPLFRGAPVFHLPQRCAYISQPRARHRSPNAVLRVLRGHIRTSSDFVEIPGPFCWPLV